MEKRNTLLLTVIAVATLLVAVVGATFAYFASSSDTANTLDLDVTTVKSTASLTAGATQLEMEITPDLMQQSTAANTSIKNTTGEITVELTSDAAATCYYDIAFTWDGTAYEPTDNLATDQNEFTVKAEYAATSGTSTQGTNQISGETQMNKIAAMTGEDGSIADIVKTGLVVDEASISSNSGATAKATWTFELNFYNLTLDQTDSQGGKNYKGTFKVVNVAC